MSNSKWVTNRVENMKARIVRKDEWRKETKTTAFRSAFFAQQTFQSPKNSFTVLYYSHRFKPYIWSEQKNAVLTSSTWDIGTLSRATCPFSQDCGFWILISKIRFSEVNNFTQQPKLFSKSPIFVRNCVGWSLGVSVKILMALKMW